MKRLNPLAVIALITAAAGPVSADQANFVENCLAPEWIPAEVCDCMYGALLETFTEDQVQTVGAIYAEDLPPPAIAERLSNGSAADQDLGNTRGRGGPV